MTTEPVVQQKRGWNEDMAYGADHVMHQVMYHMNTEFLDMVLSEGTEVALTQLENSNIPRPLLAFINDLVVLKLGVERVRVGSFEDDPHEEMPTILAKVIDQIYQYGGGFTQITS